MEGELQEQHSMQGDADPTGLGATLRERREELGLSIYEVARRSHVDRGSLHRIEAGAFKPKPEKLAWLAEVLDLSVVDLYRLAGFPIGRQLPSFQPYLRAKYRNLPPDAIERVNRYFEDIQREYGELSDGPTDGEDEQAE